MKAREPACQTASVPRQQIREENECTQQNERESGRDRTWDHDPRRAQHNENDAQILRKSVDLSNRLAIGLEAD